MSPIDESAFSPLEGAQSLPVAAAPVTSEPEPNAPLIYAVLDTNAILKMLAIDKTESDPAFSFLAGLRTPLGKAQVQFVLLHTVSRELDGLKKDQRFRHLITDFLRDARSRPQDMISPVDGLRARCLHHGILVELSEEEAEMEVMYGDRYRSCDLQGADAMILNVAWYLYTQLLELHGDSASTSVVLVTNDGNMHHWADQWHLPCTSLDDLYASYKQLPVDARDLASAHDFLSSAGIVGRPRQDESAGTSLRQVFSQAHVRTTRPQIEFLESLFPKLEELAKLEALVAGDQRTAIPVDELRSIVSNPPGKLDEDGVAATKKLIAQGYALLDTIRVGVARTESLQAMELGKKSVDPARAGSPMHMHAPHRVKFN